jgi:hypothetical protein
MIKLRTVGMYDIAKINPVLTSEDTVSNYAFVIKDGVTYLVMNDVHGDDAYKDDVTFKAGEYLNGYDLSAWVNQELVIDAKHIIFASNYDDDIVDTKFIEISSDGTLEVVDEAPESGLYFAIVGKTTLTEKAAIVRVVMGE